MRPPEPDTLLRVDVINGWPLNRKMDGPLTEIVYSNLYSAPVANYINLSLFAMQFSFVICVEVIHTTYQLCQLCSVVCQLTPKCDRYTNPHFHYCPTRSLLPSLSWPPSYAVGVPGSGPTLCRMPLWIVLLKVLGKSTQVKVKVNGTLN